MHATSDLAARVERAERGLVSEAVREVAARRPEARAFVTPLAGGVATYAGEGSPLNKVAGLGFDGVPDPADLEAVERAFAERGAPVQVELATLADPAVLALLTRRGYTLVGFENVLGLALPAATPLPEVAAVAVEASGADELDAWLEVLVSAFAAPDTAGVPSHEEYPRELLARVLTDMAGAAGFRRFLARLDGAPAGGGSLRIDGGVAQLCGAGTVPALRSRGVQTALLAHRLALATEAGCDLAVTTTQPGSTSGQNSHRRGFALLYARAVLVRVP
jgi:GNAT superfamily N-acetyltransferase